MNDGRSTKSLDVLSAMAAAEKIKTLEARLAKLEGVPIEGSDDIESECVDQLTNSSTIFEVRKCDFRAFKNRFSADDGRCAVDVLVSGALVQQEEIEETKIRDRLSQYARNHYHPTTTSKRKTSKAEAAAKESNMIAVSQIRDVQKHDLWIQRIRIQSPALLAIIAKIQKETWSSRQRTYFRPFSTLLFFYPQMKQALVELQEKWGQYADAASPVTNADMEEVNEPVDNCPAALAALQCYIDFFEKEIVPDSQRFDKLDIASDVFVRFDDLDYLFSPGDDLYRPPDSNVNATRLQGNRDYKRVWRAYFIRGSIVMLKAAKHDAPDKQGNPGLEKGVENEAAFVVRAFYLDFNGEEFITVSKDFPIMPYGGSIPITSLPIYPVRFAPNSAALIRSATEAGNQTLHYISESHGMYNGWTAIRTPSGEAIPDAATGTSVQHAEHINSEVMVDFSEAFQACTAWKPFRKILRRQAVVQEVSSDDYPILSWSNSNRDKLLGESSELVPLRTGVSAWQTKKYLTEDSLLKAIWDNYNRGKLTTSEFLRSEDTLLLTGRVFAYVFTERKFAQLNSAHLKPSGRNGNVLDSLRIPDMVKQVIQGSIQGHLLQKLAEKERGEGTHSFDLIQGKGAGLFILLHGVPGVGKSATAEAIAQFHGKPLFRIACGDLGLTPGEVESNLRGIFRLAGLWDCILLLDEVDTFFSQRSKGDAAMNKNALVSVFLRVLDYYTGILFLTTNRAGTLDEAFKSRIHYKLYYPPLTRQQTLEIWETNIQRLHQIERELGGERRAPMHIPSSAEILDYAALQFDHFESRRQDGAVPWNGRQIRNAFQVARSLAYSDAYTKAEALAESLGKEVAGVDLPRPILKIEHFQLMSDITADFDAYMREIFNGQDDADLQRELEHRADHYVPTMVDTPKRQSHFVVREPYPQPSYDGYRHGGGGDPAGIQSGFGASWKRRTSSFVNAERASSPPANPWASVRSRYRAPALEIAGPSSTADARSSSQWTPRDSAWRRSPGINDEEPLRQPSSVSGSANLFPRAPTRPTDRHGRELRDADTLSSDPPLGLTVTSRDRADGEGSLHPHSARVGSGEFAFIARARVEVTDGGRRELEDAEYSDLRNQHGKRGREAGLLD